MNESSPSFPDYNGSIGPCDIGGHWIPLRPSINESISVLVLCVDRQRHLADLGEKKNELWESLERRAIKNIIAQLPADE